MEDTNQDRSRMMAGSGKILNEDDSSYDFTAGFRALVALVAGVFTTLAASLTALTSILTAVSRGVIDEATGAYAGIDYAHHEIHDGTSFNCFCYQNVEEIGARTIIAFKTGDLPTCIHVTPLGSASGGAHARILAAPNIVDNTGASLTVFNRNQCSNNKSQVIDTSQNPDVPGQAMFFTALTMGNVTGGTEIAHAHLQEGAGKKALGGVARDTQEWQLAPNTLYAFEIESLVAEENYCEVELNWYENNDRT